MTITRKRAFSAVMGTSAAALSAAGACPPANAAPKHAPTTPKPTTVRHERRHARPHRRPTSKPTIRHGDYVYKVAIGNTVATEGKPNTACSAAGMRITGLGTFPESNNATALWERTPAAWKRHYTITTGPATTITVSWLPAAEQREAEEEATAHNGSVLNPRLWGQSDSALTSAVCAATSPGAAVAEIGEALATWVLPAPARSAAALMATPPTNIYPNEYSAAFEVRPDGSVPAFAPLAS
jgi:hypothetical protein